MFVLSGLMAKGLRCQERSNGAGLAGSYCVRAFQLWDDREGRRRRAAHLLAEIKLACPWRGTRVLSASLLNCASGQNQYYLAW